MTEYTSEDFENDLLTIIQFVLVFSKNLKRSDDFAFRRNLFTRLFYAASTNHANPLPEEELHYAYIGMDSVIERAVNTLKCLPRSIFEGCRLEDAALGIITKEARTRLLLFYNEIRRRRREETLRLN